MNVIVAKSSGFCFGVKRAVNTVYEQLEKTDRQIYTLGPIIHNEEVVSDMEKRGVIVLQSMEELKSLTSGVVIIRSHGVPKSVYKTIEAQGLECVDATCPFVKKIHRAVEEQSKTGRHIVIIGNDKHPEVEGIKGWCQGPVTVIENEKEALDFLGKIDRDVCIVSQTTFNYNKFQDLVEILGQMRYDRVVKNTICNATEERQTEAQKIAKGVDAMVVIGGKHSSNTQKLYEICRKECNQTYYIQTLVDLDLEAIQSISCVGITAGASTPNNIIEEVSKHVRNEF
ncbi:MAG: 4-hydroxy-3-methylbut-2-enyl diphosphate reductase [Lachnospiraceae bacterium]|nr:4-hydroxy-3-methylbut-2-enyl diphosphate reductase [Lachnospiraceae bacterium]